jgi:acetyltransferase
LSPQAIRYRFFQPRTQFTRLELAQATQIDYAREMAFIATTESAVGKAETLGVVRAWIDADNVSAEFAIIVDDACRGENLGRLLTEKIIDFARERGILVLRGSVLPDNQPMRRLARRLGFASQFNEDDQIIELKMPLNEPADDWQRERLAGL